MAQFLKVGFRWINLDQIRYINVHGPEPGIPPTSPLAQAHCEIVFDPHTTLSLQGADAEALRSMLEGRQS
jgi:hypothetical protein